jgi:acylphosphatase
VDQDRGSGPTHSVRVSIAGRVQGVGYRYWVERAAGRLGLEGWVRNRRDGAVEALFAGPPDKVAEMLQHCRQGPPSAQVASVTVLEEDGSAPAGFGVLPTA